MKKFYPVIHVDNYDQAIKNVNIAYDYGADGVFLINHQISHESLLRIHEKIYNEFKNDPDAKGEDLFQIGINCLDLTPFELIFAIDNTIPMIWTDNCQVHEDSAKPQTEAAAVRSAIEKTNWDGTYFGGVAFKYQKPVENLENITELASHYVDVVCTSGVGTGIAADVNKTNRMKKILGDKSLAIASGITAENVLDYKDSVDIFLVSTGISKDFLNLDEEKVNELYKKISLM